jgi:hypothetical protein
MEYSIASFSINTEEMLAIRNEMVKNIETKQSMMELILVCYGAH